ncbi:preprotein translocase subunit Sec61beta [Candidatus Woesearchaeota archaeon]|nr:preprotein translocase subunit Sec61beta [Candidatus Woesearchaeota archaeon]
MAKDKISLPSGQSGIMNYNENSHSKLRFEAGHIIVLTAIVIIVMIFLHMYY